MQFSGPMTGKLAGETAMDVDLRSPGDETSAPARSHARLRPLLVLLQLSLGLLLLTGCDLDVNLRQALILDDPSNFIGEQQIEIEIQGSSLRAAEQAGLDCEGLAARVLRDELPKYWKASWQKNYESFIIELSIPFEGLKDYGMKVHRQTQARSYLDLPETLNAASLANFRARPMDLPLDLQRGKILGEEIYERARAEVEAAPKGVSTSYFLPCRHILRDENGELLLYLSLGKQGHLTDADLSYAERALDMTPQFEALCREIQALMPEDEAGPPEDAAAEDENSAPGPRLRHSDALLIIGDQIYRCPRDRSDQGMTVLHQERQLPLVLELETRSSNFMSFDRAIRFRLPLIPGYETARGDGPGLVASRGPTPNEVSREGFFRLMDRINLELDPEEEFYWIGDEESPEGPSFAGGYLQADISRVDPLRLREWSQTHLDPSYELTLNFDPSESGGEHATNSSSGSASPFSCAWVERFELPRFFRAGGSHGETGDAAPGEPPELSESEIPSDTDGALSGSLMAEALRVESAALQPDLRPAVVSQGLIEGRQEDGPVVEIQTELDARRAWPLLGVESFWDEGVGRRFHFLLDPLDEVGFLEYLEGTELEPRATVIESRDEEPYRRLVLEVRDPSGGSEAIEAWTRELFGGSEIRGNRRKGFGGEKLELEEIFDFHKLREDQIVVLLDEGGALEAGSINPERMLPLAGRVRYELPTRSFAPYYALALLGVGILLSFRPGGSGRALFATWQARLARLEEKRREDEALRPLNWGDTFIDSNHREICLIKPANAPPAARRTRRSR